MTRTSFVSLVFCLIALPITGMAGGLDTPSTVEFAPARAADAFTTHKLPADARVSTPPTNIVEQIRSGNGTVEVIIPTASGPWRLTGERFEVLSAGADILASDAYGEHVMPTPKHAFVRGSVEGAPNSRFFLAAFDTHVSAIIEFEEPEGIRRFMVSPDTIIDGRMATVISHEVIETPGMPERCRADELEGYQERADSIMRWFNSQNAVDNKDDGVSQGAEEYAIQLALECDFRFYQRHASNFAYAAQYALTLAAAVNNVYQRDAGVQVRVPFLRVWTIADEYGDAIGERLNGIRNRWRDEMGHVERSVACLISGGGGGGLAWVGVLCGGFGYNVSGVNGNVNFPSTNYVWDIDVTSHELGHNIGSSHTHNCNWNPPIDSCWFAEGGCYNAVLPQRGTIMSYCHLQWQGTELEFHPRIATLFRARAQTRDCFGPVSNVHDTDLAVIDILDPFAGSTVTNGEEFNPRVVIKNVGTTRITGATLEFRLAGFPNDTLSTISVNLSALDAGEVDTILFQELLLDEDGQYLAEATVIVGGDKLATNNQVTRPFQVGEAPSSSITVITPNGREVYHTGDTVQIEYDYADVVRFKTEWSYDNGETWNTIRNRTTASSAPIEWIVPAVPLSIDTNEPNPSCWIRMVAEDDSRVRDLSDAAFSIFMSTDVEAYDVIDPQENTTVASPIAPKVVVRNNAVNPATDVEVSLSIRWVRRETPTYDTTIVVPVIDPRSSITLNLPQTPLLANGAHVVDLRVALDGDQNPSNNRYWRAFTAEGLSAPQSVRAEHGPNRVIVEWDAPASMPGDTIELWRGTSGADMEPLKRFTWTVRAWLDETVSDDVEYAYALRLVRGGVASSFTDMLLATPHTYPLGTELAAAQGVGPEHNATDVPLPADLVWQSVRGADRYEVQIAADQNFERLQHVYITHADGALLAPVGYGETIWWRVRAINETYNGPWGRPLSFGATESCAGNAAFFNGEDARGTNDEFVWEGGPVTVEFWQYVQRADRKNSSSFAIGQGDNTANRFQAHVPWGNGRIYWDYGAIGDSGRMETPYGSAWDRWAHFAFVSDGESFMRIYIDGQLVASRNGAMEATDLQGITIGAQNDRNWLKGAMDEFRVWTVVRTGQQIRESMNRREPDDKTGLIGFWRFSDGAGTRVLDESGWSRNITLSETTLWLESGATINCVVAGTLGTPSLTNAGTVPATTVHRYSLSWSEVPGAQWYDFELYLGEEVAGRWLHQAQNLERTEITIGGLPPATMCTWRVRARSTTATGEWAEGKLLTPEACESMMAFFPGDGSHLINEDFLFSGRSTTIEYWAYVADADVGDRSSFIIGDTDPTTARFQAHAPWRDKQVFFDYGDRLRGGRINTGIDNTIDRWTHFALASNGIDDMRIYVDGQLRYQSSFALNPGDKQRIAIAANDISNNRFRGYMSDFRVWNVLRSEEQIRESMYERMVGGRSHLMGSWPLDDGSGLIGEDVTSHLHDVTAGREPGWEADTTGLLMHTPPALRGPYVAVKGDTVTYALHTDQSSTTSFRVRNGIIIDRPDQRTVTIQWVDNTASGEICVTRIFPSGCVDSACYQILLREPVSVDEDVISNTITVSPNPSSTMVNVSLPSSIAATSYQVVSSIGQIVRSGAIETSTFDIDVSMLSSGTYRLVAISPSGIQTIPIVVQR